MYWYKDDNIDNEYKLTISYYKHSTCDSDNNITNWSLESQIPEKHANSIGE